MTDSHADQPPAAPAGSPPAGAPAPRADAATAPSPRAARQSLWARIGLSRGGELELADGARPSVGRLRRHRRRLGRRRQEAMFHLGGLAFELYRRNRLSDDVMRLRAAEVSDLDRSVGEIDALLRDYDRERRERREPAAAPAGSCMSCRTPFLPGARFCSNCGASLVAPVEGSEQVTGVIGPARGGR